MTVERLKSRIDHSSSTKHKARRAAAQKTKHAPQAQPLMSETLVTVENVSMKFCRSLKKSLWYGVRDVAGALNPFSRDDGAASQSPELRPDEFWAVQNVSFELKRGECLGLIGHNGAGKSTLLKILNGLIPPDTGRITMRGRVCALIELNAGFNPILSGRENIFNQAALLGFSKEETLSKFDAIVDFAEISDFLDMPVQNYSSGMRVRLGFAIAAQMEPDVLIIDEVLAVGDVAFRFKCINAISQLIESAAVIFVSHSMPQVFRVSSAVMMLDRGRTCFCGTDVGAGVANYLSLLENVDSKVFGTNEVTIEGVAIDSGGRKVCGSEALAVRHGEPLRLRVQVHAVAGIKSARLQFVIWNAEMIPVMDVMTESLEGYPFCLAVNGAAIIEADIPRLELNAGKYMISVHVTADDLSRTYCRIDNAAHVVVHASTASGAHLLSIARWSEGPSTIFQSH